MNSEHLYYSYFIQLKTRQRNIRYSKLSTKFDMSSIKIEGSGENFIKFFNSFYLVADQTFLKLNCKVKI